ncbi:hypothetical protein FOMA001_g14155 [Fusarium oxysporum f. sp. matthiolae]|nr:hypothetical protein FOMA001_g14155 [Fusarium oxysporum f. sp. matthiolae]
MADSLTSWESLTCFAPSSLPLTSEWTSEAASATPINDSKFFGA